ncbi:hypothetical protein CEXT_722311 [Caerostris extrusa]|uniref:Uncharacterized protein n=1 Tax=Caerostris extrusa TaxID=172846 RepID=A0AAV4VI38_CAEEX|nr:hypothetical protein CEXT_722311 [Caerostris extrusa]
MCHIALYQKPKTSLPFFSIKTTSGTRKIVMKSLPSEIKARYLLRNANEVDHQAPRTNPHLHKLIPAAVYSSDLIYPVLRGAVILISNKCLMERHGLFCP